MEAVADDQRDRQLDAADARSHRAGPSRSAAGRRPRLPEAGWTVALGRRSLGPGQRGGGGGVLRPIRAMGRARGPACAARRNELGRGAVGRLAFAGNELELERLPGGRGKRLVERLLALVALLEAPPLAAHAKRLG